MTIVNQLSSLPIPGGDLYFKNYTGSDIGAGLAVTIDASNNGSNNVDPPGILLPVVAPSVIPVTLGITLETIKTLKNGRVRTIGGAVGTADGAIAYGQWVEASNANGKLGRVRLAQGNTPVLGMCLSQTAADADPVLILLLPGAMPRQSGAGTLASGTVTISNVVLTANSNILLSRKTQGGTVTNTVVYDAPSASRNTGAGTFVINACVAAGTTNAADNSVIDWMIVN